MMHKVEVVFNIQNNNNKHRKKSQSSSIKLYLCCIIFKLLKQECVGVKIIASQLQSNILGLPI